MSARRTGWLFVLAVFAYCCVFVVFSPLELQDYPNHLARALVMADLIFNKGAQFGQHFQYHFLFTPYVLGDLLLATLVQVTGVAAAAAIWATLVFLCLPCALFLYLRARDTSPEVTLLMLFISLYFSTDTFFVLGFLEFRLSIAVVLGVLALAQWCRNSGSVISYALYAAAIVVAYLIHLAAVVFIGAAVGLSAAWRILFRKARFMPEAVLLLPVGGMVAWHILAADYRQSQDLVAQTTHWGAVPMKIRRLGWGFIRYNRSNDVWVIATFAAFVSRCLSEKWSRARCADSSPKVREPLILGLLFLAMYVVFPDDLVEASYIDVRPLALAPIFLLLAMLNPSPASQPGSADRCNAPLVALAAAVAFVNLGFLALHFHRESVWLAQYRAVVAKIPEHAVVLPVFTGRRVANVHDHLHAGSFAVIDRHALIPFLFTGDGGNPMKYFRYRDRPYLPEELWYQRGLDSQVDWGAVSRGYAYLLIMKPYAAERIPVKTHLVSENDAAALVAIE